MDSSHVKPGIEVFLEDRLNLVKGRKVGLITNPSGVNSLLQNTADLFFHHPEIELAALFGPEHGVRGNAQAGEFVPFTIDGEFNIPVFSLYGQSEKPDPGTLQHIDKFMRFYDTQAKGKILEDEMVENVDVLVFDLQDVGTRVYTYIATMAYSMLTCARHGIDFIVLDRPNPINGVDMEGPLLQYPEFSSFVGLYPIPVRHGMTVGELAGMFNDKYLEHKVNLKVISMEGWEREMWFDDTGLPWVAPSPNMPTLHSAVVYPGQVFLEGTNVSEGRGTTTPFELFGAPWIDGFVLAASLNQIELPGIRFEGTEFRPTFSKFQGESCGGCQIHVLDRKKFKPLKTSLHIIKTVQDKYPDSFRFFSDYFDNTMGTAGVRKALEGGETIENIVRTYTPDENEFSSARNPYLLY